MASENETVAEIAKEMRGYPLCWLTPEGIPQMSHDNEELSKYADRIEAAWRREKETSMIAARFAQARFGEALKERDVAIAELRECLKDAVHEVCFDCDNQDEYGCSVCRMKCAVQKWRKALEGEAK